MSNRFYVYEHWRPDRDECFYVGKGKGKRAYEMNRNNPHHRNIIKKLQSLGMCAEIRLVADGLEESDAFAMEIERIAFWRSIGVNIVNVSSGGQGPSGRKHTPSWREAMSAIRKGRRQSKEWVSKRVSQLKGKKHTEKSLENMRIARRKVKPILTEEGRKRISDAAKARKFSPESIEKMRIAAKARGISPATRASTAGKKKSPEVVERMRQARWGHLIKKESV